MGNVYLSTMLSPPRSPCYFSMPDEEGLVLRFWHLRWAAPQRHRASATLQPYFTHCISKCGEMETREGWRSAKFPGLNSCLLLTVMTPASTMTPPKLHFWLVACKINLLAQSSVFSCCSVYVHIDLDLCCGCQCSDFAFARPLTFGLKSTNFRPTVPPSLHQKPCVYAVLLVTTLFPQCPLACLLPGLM